jgi:hypothetical protein
VTPHSLRRTCISVALLVGRRHHGSTAPARMGLID